VPLSCLVIVQKLTVLAQFAIVGSSASAIGSSVEAAIRESHLAPGQQLPTIRALAADLGVSPMTVASAYRELRRRGLLTADGRRGTRVSARPPLPVTAAPLVPPGTRDLATGSPDPALLPEIAAALAKIDRRARAQPESDKLEQLVALAEADFSADGIATAALTIVAGALDGVERVLIAHLVPGDAVAVEDPAFVRVLDLVSALGLVTLPVAVDDDGPRPDELEAALAGGASAFILTPRWQNPFGARLSEKRAYDLREVLDRHENVLVVEDDYAGPIANERAYSLCAGRTRWATVRSVSKAFGADFRVALMTGDEATIARVEGRQLLATGWISHILQELVVNLWTDAVVREGLEHSATIYAARRRRFLDALAGNGIAAHGASGLNVWIPVVEESATVAALQQRGWAVIAGERWRLRAGPALRVTTSTLGDEESETLADDLSDVLLRRRGAYTA
jgi:DNA-binding transcriptional MocR family regulator